MYEELVSHLRECAKLDPSENTFAEAADAIEDLQNERDMYSKAMTDEHNKAAKIAWKHRWIPVTERLPEAAYGCLVVVDDYEPMTGADFLNYYPEYVGYDGKQWNDYDGEQLPCEVVYWMKMPELPKDGEEQ